MFIHQWPTEADYLWIHSIMFWTLTLIGVVKYTGFALNADDQGEGTKVISSEVIGFFIRADESLTVRVFLLDRYTLFHSSDRKK